MSVSKDKVLNEMKPDELIEFEKQLSKFEKDTLTTYLASITFEWPEEKRDGLIQGLCLMEGLLFTDKKTETGSADFEGIAPASSTDELTK